MEDKIKLFQGYLVERELSPNTIDAYITAMRQFFSKYSEVTKENGLAWKRELLGDGMKPKSVNIKLNAFNSYCEMMDLPRDKVKTVRVHNATAVSNVISEADYRRLLQALVDDGDDCKYFRVKLFAATGARVSEYIQLKKSDFDRGYAEMWTKGKIRRIYIPKSFREEAADHYKDLTDDDFLVRSSRGSQLTTRAVSEMLQRLAVKYNIDKKVMHPHSFRHLFALEFLKRNSNLSLLADVMGHSSISTTAIYTRMTKEQQADAVNETINW